jgi:hypothetical protein
VSLYKLKPEDRNLFEEFKARPVGHHSPELQKVLNLFRRGSIEGKYVLVCTKPHQEWVLAQLPMRRGGRVKIHHNRIFHSLKEAELEVFKLRWLEHTGERLDD